MASVSPLYYSGGNLLEMSSGEITEWQQKAIYVYSQSPTAVITVVSSSGALIDSMDDTRTQAGTTSQSESAFLIIPCNSRSEFRVFLTIQSGVC